MEELIECICDYVRKPYTDYAVMLNGITALAINHFDTIGKLDKIKLCVGYNHKGEITTDFTTDVGFLEECTAIYEEFDGNFGDISRIKNKEDLPQQALKYLARIEEYVGVPVKFIGTGAGRENIIIIK